MELVDEKSTTLALTAVDFLKDISEAERTSVQIVASFDTTGCAVLASQIALVSRLHSVLEMYKDDPDSLHAHVEQAVLNIRENWSDRPSWWSADNSEFDMLLLRRLARDGFEGFMHSKMSFGLEATVSCS